MNKKTKHVVIGSGIAAAGVGAVGVVHRAITKYFVDVALNRQVPKHAGSAEQKLSGCSINQQFSQTISDAAEKLGCSDCEAVEIACHDGTKLVGHWYQCEDAQRIIIAMHGWRSSWTHDFGAIADFWKENKCSVLYAEQRGQGGSGGDYMGFGLLERYDCFDWINWVNEQLSKKLPIYLAGISMGASTVLMAAGLELPRNVCGIIADCGYTSTSAIWKHVAQDNLRLAYSIYSTAANDLCRKKLQIGIDDYSCVDAMQQCKVPVLFIHGTDDHFVPIEMTYENYKACAAPKQLLVVPGAEHGMSYLVDKAGYEEAVKKFWQENDQPISQ